MKRVRDNPEIYDKTLTDNNKKTAAWEKISQELGSTVSACEIMFEQSLKAYRQYSHRDPQEKCRLNAKYWNHMQVIYSDSKKPRRTLNIRTPSEINTLTEINTIADNFEPDITIHENNKDTVLQNYMKAIKSLPLEAQIAVSGKLNIIFDKYRKQNEMASAKTALCV